MTPTILAKYGFDSLFITRVGTNIKEKLRSDGHLQFIWKGHPSNEDGKESSVFVQVLQPELYSVTNKLFYDANFDNPKCGISHVLEEDMDCLDLFITD